MTKQKTAQLEKPVWLKTSEEELKKIIAELAGKYPPAQVGIILRDQYGIPTTRIFGKKLAVYLKEAGIDTKNVELQNVEKKLEKMKEHLKKHKQDKKAKHKIQKPQSRVEKIKKYLATRN
jgi:ribosomal protein S15P/S13E